MASTTSLENVQEDINSALQYIDTLWKDGLQLQAIEELESLGTSIVGLAKNMEKEAKLGNVKKGSKGRTR